MKEDRKYVLMTTKHATKQEPLFWGSPTKDEEERSFGGYTSDPRLAERYSMAEITNYFGDSLSLLDPLPIDKGWGLVREWNYYDWHRQPKFSEDIFVTPMDVAMDYRS